MMERVAYVWDHSYGHGRPVATIVYSHGYMGMSLFNPSDRNPVKRTGRQYALDRVLYPAEYASFDKTVDNLSAKMQNPDKIWGRRICYQWIPPHRNYGIHDNTMSLHRACEDVWVKMVSRVKNNKPTGPRKRARFRQHTV